VQEKNGLILGHSECTTNNIAEAWAPLAQWLRCNKRQAFNTETGGGFNTASCMTFMCQQIAFQAQNSDGTYFAIAALKYVSDLSFSFPWICWMGQYLSKLAFYNWAEHLSLGRWKLFHGIRAFGAARTERHDVDGYPAGSQMYGSKSRRTEGINGPVILAVMIYTSYFNHAGYSAVKPKHPPLVAERQTARDGITDRVKGDDA
jgi:hypothetical protein